MPALWTTEVANGLVMMERRGRIIPTQADAIAQALLRLPIEVRPPLAPAELSRLVDLARRHGLTAYDAAYLDLALREELPLATLDRRLDEAAAAAGAARFTP